jgi:DNA-binding NarL/FixJ family response regulator
MIRVCLVDDQTLVREGIRRLLELTDDVRVVAEAEDGRAALKAIAAHDPDVVLLDLRMPVLDGLGTLRELAERGCEAPCVVLTTFDDDDLALRALQAGARGFLLKDVSLEQLVGAIHAVAAGSTLVQPALTDRLVRAMAQLDDPDDSDLLPPPQPLTERELEILRLLAGGYSNAEIADTLFLATGTVKNHVSNVLLKLGVRDRTRAVLRALHLGLLTCTESTSRE